ncbi:anaerobic ribonucleoside-triphosphate reductase activating protein [Candidatus Falkowbacteria bacterium]|nr:anaerobic ribonucleoside-triphosphate reductase activating protein [Candidatus Falkowbacteria bacterium]
MLIGGLQKTTLLDYPNKVAATVFTIGCNFRCSFCHNPDIVKGITRVIPVPRVLRFLQNRKKLLDAVCLSGGEPTIQRGLVSFIKKIKALGYLVKLDTNGARPDVIEKLLAEKLVDYIAMDIKAKWEDYQKVTCRIWDLDAVKKSAIMLMKSEIPYEFRSTVLPVLHREADLLAIAEQIKGAARYYLQPFKSESKLVNDNFVGEKTYSKKQLNDFISKIKGWFSVCEVR